MQHKWMRWLPGFHLVLSCLCIAACSHEPQKTTTQATDPTYISSAATAIVLSEDNHFAGITVDESRNNAGTPDLHMYLVDLKTGEHQPLGTGTSQLLAVGGGHQFLFSVSEQSPISLMDGLHTVRSFAIGKHLGGWWNASAHLAIFETGWPGDREGFNAVGLLNLQTGEMSSVQLRQPTELLATCNNTGHFYADVDTDPNGSDEYDAQGMFISRSASSLRVYSAQCRYVLPLITLSPHGPSDWAVYDAVTGTKMMDFPWSDTDSNSHWFIAWNPRYDHLLLAGSQGDTTDVVDVEQRAIVKRLPGSAPAVWSGDGKSTVTIRDHHIVFEELPDNVLMK